MNSLLNRFTSKTSFNEATQCLEWTASRTKTGYGRFHFAGETQRAHRVAYTLAHGEIPEGLFVLHKCDNPSCVNVKHLRLGTTQENTADRTMRNRHHNTHKTHCPRGHEYTEENTAHNNGRQCRACKERWR